MQRSLIPSFAPACLVSVALMLIAGTLKAQEGSTQLDPEEIIEELLEGSGTDEADEDALADELAGYRARRIDLYTTTADQLARLPGISLHNGIAILDYVDRLSPSSMKEFDTLSWLDAEELLSLRSYTTLRGRPRQMGDSPTGPAVEIRSRALLDLQPRRGYHDDLRRVLLYRDPLSGDTLRRDTISLGPSYLGSRHAFLQRIHLTWGSISGGVTAEKDAGEPIVYNDTAAYSYIRLEHVNPDSISLVREPRLGGFLSAHLSVRLRPLTIYAGDYSAELGGGLVMGGLFGRFKGGEVTKSPWKKGRGITAHRSTGETGFYRGAAIVFNRGVWLPARLSATLFASSRNLDASFASTIIDGDSSIAVTSIREDGYRRTRGELRRSVNLREVLLGGNIEYRSLNLSVGITGYSSRYSAPFLGDRDGDFRGDDVMIIGIDGRYTRRGLSLFGEIARSTDGTIGGLGGILTSIGHTDLALALRYLPPGFHTPHGSGFGESPTQQQNEHGAYLAVSTPLTSWLRLSAYLDLYRNPERTSSIPLPRSGAEGYLQIEGAPATGLTLRLRLKDEIAGEGFTLEDEFGRDRKRLVERRSTSGRIEAEYGSRSDIFRIRGRFERRLVDYGRYLPASDGILTLLDLRLRPFAWLSLGTRFVLFDTDNFESAIYELEHDLPGRSTSLALSGEGHRLYLYTRWQPLPGLIVAVKYSETLYVDRTRISVGELQEISGPASNSLGLQIDLSF